MTQATTSTPEQTAMIKAIMSEYDIHFLFDDSGSMNLPHKAGSSQTRWQAAKELAATCVAASAEIDSDGLNIALMNGLSGRQKLYRNAGMAEVDAIFAQPANGSTPLHLGLESIFSVAGESPKKDIIVCLTDGAPDDKHAAIAKIVAQANKQTSDDDLTILFVQLGNDAEATKILKGYDDDIKAKFDIVDSVTCDDVYAAPSFAHILQAAIAG